MSQTELSGSCTPEPALQHQRDMSMACHLQSAAYLPQEKPLAVVEEADDGSNDNSTQHILGHVLEDGGQEQQHKHDNNGTDYPCQLSFGAAGVHDG